MRRLNMRINGAQPEPIPRLATGNLMRLSLADAERERAQASIEAAAGIPLFNR